MRDLKPIYFNVVVWGGEFVEFFVGQCLPSLLASGNLPSLELGKQNQFIICCPTEDWQLIKESESFRKAEKFVTFVHLEIPYPPAGVSGCEHMGIGHKAATDMMFRDNVFGCLLTPDLILAKGSLSTLQSLAQQGKQLVLATSLRAQSDSFLKAIQNFRVESEQGEEGSLNISPRDLMACNLKNLHSETAAWNFEAGYFARDAVGAWFANPRGAGVLFYSLSWAPVLIDYALVEDHDTSMLEADTIDANYLNKNISDWKNLHVIQDTDDFAMVSWAPADDRPVPNDDDGVRSHPKYGHSVSSLILRERFLSPAFDDLKRTYFLKPLRMHSEPIDREWEEWEAGVNQVIESVVSESKRRFSMRQLRWYFDSLAAHLTSTRVYKSFVLWLILRVYRPRANKGIKISYVIDNFSDLYQRLSMKLSRLLPFS